MEALWKLRNKNFINEDARCGIGTLIIFIAMVLVAAWQQQCWSRHQAFCSRKLSRQVKKRLRKYLPTWKCIVTGNVSGTTIDYWRIGRSISRRSPIDTSTMKYNTLIIRLRIHHGKLYWTPDNTAADNVLENGELGQFVFNINNMSVRELELSNSCLKQVLWYQKI